MILVTGGTGLVGSHLLFDLIRSGTRKEEMLIPKVNLNRVWILRRLLQEMNPVDAMEFIIGKIKKTETNQEFLDSMNS